MNYKFYVREFLNKPGKHTTAFIHAFITYPNGNWPSECLFEIADCNKMISLNFELLDDDEIDNAVEKIDKLTDNLRDFRLALLDAATKARELNERRQEDSSP